jgi:hypothetical protein
MSPYDELTLAIPIPAHGRCPPLMQGAKMIWAAEKATQTHVAAVRRA